MLESIILSSTSKPKPTNGEDKSNGQRKIAKGELYYTTALGYEGGMIMIDACLPDGRFNCIYDDDSKDGATITLEADRIGDAVEL